MHAFYHRRSISLQKKIKNDPNLLFSYNYSLYCRFQNSISQKVHLKTCQRQNNSILEFWAYPPATGADLVL